LAGTSDELASIVLLEKLDIIFVFVFTAELGVNLVARWFWPFFQNPWCVFDFIVVGVSLISLAPINMPLNLMLLFRCCRVLRVVGRFKTIRNIFTILVSSVVPMAGAFFLIFLLSSICEYS
jgi:voltage-gated sodium channel